MLARQSSADYTAIIFSPSANGGEISIHAYWGIGWTTCV